MWSTLLNSSFTLRILQSALLLTFFLSLFKGLQRSRPLDQTVKDYYVERTSTIQSFFAFSPSNETHHPQRDEEGDIAPLEATRITPKELMNRTLPYDRTRAPKLLHQSWKNDRLPYKFQRWSTTCRRMNHDWEYVLWSDLDNLRLIRKYAPWFLKSYQSLKSEIYRADAMRNVYMHVFGGYDVPHKQTEMGPLTAIIRVYADLDTECLRPYDELFVEHNITTASYHDLNNTLPPSRLTSNVTAILPTRKAFLGRMGTDDGSGHSIPNAWMASTPGHPFWLLPLEKIKAHIKDGGSPEALTGPISLYDEANYYQSRYHGEEEKEAKESLDQRYARSEWADLYPARDMESLHFLPFWKVYPYSWQRDGDMTRMYCLVGTEEFNSTRCKEVLGVKAWGSFSITYWSHSWNENGGNNLKALKDETKKEEDEKEEEENTDQAVLIEAGKERESGDDDTMLMDGDGDNVHDGEDEKQGGEKTDSDGSNEDNASTDEKAEVSQVQQEHGNNDDGNTNESKDEDLDPPSNPPLPPTPNPSAEDEKKVKEEEESAKAKTAYGEHQDDPQSSISTQDSEKKDKSVKSDETSKQMSKTSEQMEIEYINNLAHHHGRQAKPALPEVDDKKPEEDKSKKAQGINPTWPPPLIEEGWPQEG